jgi:hypothetical protein
MPKKLLIHVGYPKTATTTLQDGLFLPLHKGGYINFLGRSRNSNSDYFEQAGTFSRSLFKDNELDDHILKFSSDVLNILSEETLTFPTFLKEKQWKSSLTKSTEFPSAIQNKLKGKVDDIEILVTIRNQPSLIYSLYVTKYRYFLDDIKPSVPSNSLFEADGSFKKDLFSIYYFSEVLKKYADTFGKDKLHIVLFEDFKADKNSYYQQLAKIIDVEKDLVEKSLNGVHHRKKEELKSGYKREFKDYTRTGQIVRKMEDSFFKFDSVKKLEKKYNSNKYVTFVKNNYLTNKRVYSIPKLTTEQKESIINEFKESNLELANEFNLNTEKLKNFNYI